MAMKKKKMEKRTSSKPGEKSPSLSGAMIRKESNPDDGKPVIAGIGRSFYTLLDRTKAYLGSGKKAET
jgi:hypothetical protein